MHDYELARGSSERAAWDRLDEDERLICDHWAAVRQGRGDDSALMDELAGVEGADRRALILAAMSYGSLAPVGR